MSDTRSTTGLYAMLRDSMRAFTDPQARSLTTLQVPIYNGTGPSQIDWSHPYGVCRLYNRATSGDTHGQRESMNMELAFFGRPRGTAAALVEQAGDVIDGWLLQYRSAAAGLAFSKGRTRDTLPPFADPADREVYQIRIVASLVVWPQLLTQYLTSGVAP
jgi:hypothetical protein